MGVTAGIAAKNQGGNKLCVTVSATIGGGSFILLLIFGNGNTCGCDNGCGCDNNNCGCGNNWWWIIILALLGAFGENGLGCGCDNNSCGCGNNNTCGCGC